MYCSVPLLSVCPSSSTLAPGYFLTKSIAFFSSASSAFLMFDLSKSKLTWMVRRSMTLTAGGGGGGGGGGKVTVTVTLQVVEPPMPATFAGYEAVEVGLTVFVPPVAATSVPSSTADFTLPDVVNLRVADSPCSISLGAAV